MTCPACRTRVVAPRPAGADATPFGPRLHAVATYLKTFQALSYERLQAALSDLFGLRLSQGGLMNLLRRAQGCFAEGRNAALACLRQAPVVASDETGVRIEGTNSWHWVFRCQDAVVHHAAPSRAAAVVGEVMAGHRPAVWLSDRYSAQQGHGERQQTCLAHLARDVAYVVEAGDDLIALRLQWWLDKAFGLARGLTELAASTLARKRARVGAGPRRHPEGPGDVRSGPGAPGPDAPGARPTPDLRGLPRGGGRDQQRLRARPAAGGDPAQGDERLSGDVGRPGRGGRAHRRRHRRPHDQGDSLRHPPRDHHRLIKTPPPTTEGEGENARAEKYPLGNYHVASPAAEFLWLISFMRAGPTSALFSRPEKWTTFNRSFHRVRGFCASHTTSPI